MKTAEHICNFFDVVRLGRSHYACKKCGKDISLSVFFAVDCEKRPARPVETLDLDGQVGSNGLNSVFNEG